MRSLLIEFYLLRNVFAVYIILGSLVKFFFPLICLFSLFPRHPLFRSFIRVDIWFLFYCDYGILLSVNSFTSLEGAALSRNELCHFCLYHVHLDNLCH
jgi:hypothetical protein